MTKNGMLSRFGSGKARAATRDGQNATGARANAPIGRVGARGVRAAIVAGAVSLGLFVPAAALADGEGAPVQPKPVSTAAPTLSGTPAPGQTLTCSTGTWSNNPTSYAYAWLRDGVAIAGQTGSAYLVQSADQGHSISCQVTATNSGGEYTIEGLPSGSYTVFFEAFEGNYLRGYYDAKASEAEATPVSVTVPNTTSGINGSLGAGGQVTGRITAESSGAPLVGLEVCAFDEATNDFHGCANTNGAGEYTLSSLPTASYAISFYTDSCGENGCEQENYLRATRSGVTVTAGATTSNIDAALRTGARISGKVTAEIGGAPIAEVDVCAADTAISYSECAWTNEKGEYTIVALETGTYEVEFTAGEVCSKTNCTQQNYLPTIYPGTITLTAGGTESPVNIAMAPGGQISGTATGSEGSAGIEVCASNISTEAGACTFTSENGAYTISALESGEYSVEFRGGYVCAGEEFNCTPIDYLTQTHSGHVSVTAGKDTSPINATMVAGGRISGKVTAASGGAPVAEIEACAYDTAGDNGCAITNANGEYTIQALPSSASYEVSFYPFEGNYLSQFYDGKQSAGEATPVSVSQGATTSNINAALSPGGEISGIVTAAGGGPLADVWVCAYEVNVAYRCGISNSGGGSTSASSNALAVPAPVSTFEEKGKATFNPKTGELEFVFEVSNPGTFEWSLDFQNADVGFADSLGISAGHVSGAADAVAIAAGKHGKHHGAHKKRHSAKCKKGEVKHKGKCVHKLVPFATGKQSISTPGKVTIAVKPDAQAVKALDKGDTLHVTGEFTFSSALGGTPTTVDVKAVTHGKKPKHKKHHGKGKKHQHHKKH